MLRSGTRAVYRGGKELNHLEDVKRAAEQETDRVTRSQATEKAANKVKHNQKDADHETKRRRMD